MFVVTQDYTTLPGASAAVMAHELGHNFGFEHDDDIDPCECDDPSELCIMSTYARLAPSANSLTPQSVDVYTYCVKAHVKRMVCFSSFGGSVVERRSLIGELSLVCIGPAADG